MYSLGGWDRPRHHCSTSSWLVPSLIVKHNIHLIDRDIKMIVIIGQWRAKQSLACHDNCGNGCSVHRVPTHQPLLRLQSSLSETITPFTNLTTCLQQFKSPKATIIMITTGWLGFGGIIFVVSHFIYSTIGKGAFFFPFSSKINKSILVFLFSFV